MFKTVKRNTLLIVTMIVLCVSFISFSFMGTEKNPKVSKYKEYEISGPYSFKNLDIFLVHGEDKIKAENILTLEEAMEQKKLVVYETSNVNRLMVENKSKDSTIYIQSGDIVKGGKQDRVMKNDMMVPPESKKLPVDSFCVEAGRWSQRGNENQDHFTSSKNIVTSKKAKLAVKHVGSQQTVWGEVAGIQEKLKSSMNTPVKSRQSESSLQLTLENEALKKETGMYTKHLGNIIENKKDTLGFIFAINGEINSADIYPSQMLFKKLWTRLFESCAVEAISEIKSDNPGKENPLTGSDIIKWLAEIEKGKESKKAITDSVELNVKESDANVTFETVDKNTKTGNSRWIHKNYIKKSKKK
jgi:hypothetical protein